MDSKPDHITPDYWTTGEARNRESGSGLRVHSLVLHSRAVEAVRRTAFRYGSRFCRQCALCGASKEKLPMHKELFGVVPQSGP